MMKKKYFYLISILVLIILASLYFYNAHNNYDVKKLLRNYSETGKYYSIVVSNPLNGSVFPPEIAPPTFQWNDTDQKSNTWIVLFKSKTGENIFNAIVKKNCWQPTLKEWNIIKNNSIESKIDISIIGINEKYPYKILSNAAFSIMTSKDKVDDSIIYREVMLPLRSAIINPKLLRWRSGDISLTHQPNIVLENNEQCVNCHFISFKKGSMGLNIKYNGDESSYNIEDISSTIKYSKNKIIRWSDFKNGINKNPTFGKTAFISPDGKYVVIAAEDQYYSEIKDEIAFSQNTFPVKGKLVIYSIADKSFKELPGANDPRFIYSPQAWSPDSKFILFARAKAYKRIGMKADYPFINTKQGISEFHKYCNPFKYDLYRIPFNLGKGGISVPIKGASFNGMSNYFPRYSPDGKWIVFCKSKSSMLLQPDSKLYIIPSSGGTAREMRCNTKLMNSWHSWSSNSRWLVFSSKVNSPYTQMFLTHVDENGQDSPPILLENFSSPDRAINLPEFINRKFGKIRKINIKF